MEKKNSNKDAIKTIQALYNKLGYGYTSTTDNTLLYLLSEYNKTLEEPYLATGQSCYYSEQIAKNGLTNLHFDQETIDDINYIFQCFGKKPYAKKGDIPIVFTTLLGTTEFNYATQSFPAFIYEDVFKGSVFHTFSIAPKVGEREQDFLLRVMEYNIENSTNFNLSNKEECLIRTKGIIDRFCSGKNRIYLIKIKDILDKKYSYGDIEGQRTRNATNEDINRQIEDLPTIEETLHSHSYFYEDFIYGLYSDYNWTDEYGVAIYGNLSEVEIAYIEVDRIYDVWQKIAYALGCKEGEEIPKSIMEGSIEYKDLYDFLDSTLKEVVNDIHDKGIEDINKTISDLTKPQISRYYDMFGRGR